MSARRKTWESRHLIPCWLRDSGRPELTSTVPTCASRSPSWSLSLDAECREGGQYNAEPGAEMASLYFSHRTRRSLRQRSTAGSERDDGSTACHVRPRWRGKTRSEFTAF